MFALILYHGIDSGERWERPMTATDREYVLSRRRFESHIDYLFRAGIRVSSLAECHASADRDLRIALTFDDGDASCFTTAAPILERYGFAGEFFVVSRWIGRPGFMSRAQVRELALRGHRIHSHSCTHPRLPLLDMSGIERELEASKREIEAVAEAPVEYFSVPNGAYDSRVVEAAARASYRGVLSSVAGYNQGDAFVLRRFTARGYTDVSEIASICERPRYTAARAAIRRSTLGALKHVLGERYLTVRDALISRRNPT